MSSSDSKQFPITTSKWNPHIEKTIKDIGESCKGYKWMHIKLAKLSMQKYNYLMYLTICTGPLAGLFATIASSKGSCDNEYRTLQVLVIACSFFSGVLASVVKYSKYNQKSIDHKTAAAKYTSLEGNVRRQLSLCREDRVNAGKYLQWVSDSFDDLFSGSPLISNDVYREWVVFAKKYGLVIPKEYGIMVNMEPIKDMSNIGDIKINNRDTTDSPSGDNRDEENPNISIPVVNTEFRRTDRYTAYPELKKYTDPRMEYELSRMFGMYD